MKKEEKYYAIVGRKPYDENSLWTSSRPMTRDLALVCFSEWLHDGEEEKAEIEKAEGSHTYIDAIFVSNKPILMDDEPIVSLP